MKLAEWNWNGFWHHSKSWSHGMKPEWRLLEWNRNEDCWNETGMKTAGMSSLKRRKKYSGVIITMSTLLWSFSSCPHNKMQNCFYSNKWTLMYFENDDNTPVLHNYYTVVPWELFQVVMEYWHSILFFGSRAFNESLHRLFSWHNLKKTRSAEANIGSKYWLHWRWRLHSGWLSDECQNLLRFRPRILTPQQVLVSFWDSLTRVGGFGNETRQVQRLGMRLTTSPTKSKISSSDLNFEINCFNISSNLTISSLKT